MSLPLTCSAILRANSTVAMLSMGTAITPRSAHPKNTETHSAEFGPQIRMRSPLLIPRASNSRAN